MPLIRDLREKKEEFKKSLEKRFVKNDNFIKGLSQYEKFRELKKQTDDLRAERNKFSHEFAKTKDKKIIEKVKGMKQKLLKNQEELNKIEIELRKTELVLPNWVDDEVPKGRGEDDNVAIKYIGTPLVLEKNIDKFKNAFPNVKFKVGKEIPHHSDLVESLGLVDMETAANIAGARFYIEKEELTMLDLALSLFTMKEFSKLGFTPIVPPYMIKKKVEEKITFFTAFEDSIYSLNEDDLLLITTSEHPLAAMFDKKLFEQNELPKRFVAFSPAFRREAGSHGKDTKGIFRTHQFNKVELHSITASGEGKKELDHIIEVVEIVMEKLNFPYRIVANSSGDMDKRARVQYDLEAWFPAQNMYRELHSFASVGSWVSEKLGTRVRGKESNPFVDNIYGTGAAIQRTILAILVNNYDTKTQKVKIPKELAELSGIKEIPTLKS